MAERLSAELSLDISAFSAALQQAGAKIQQFASDVTAKLNAATAAMGASTSATQANQAASSQLSVAYLAMAKSIADQTAAYTQAQSASLAYRKQQDELRESLRQTREEQRRLADEAKASASTFKAAWTAALAVFGVVNVTALLRGLVREIKEFVTDSIAGFAEFERGLLKIASLIPSVTKDSPVFAKLGEDIHALAVKTGIDTGNIQKAWFDTISVFGSGYEAKALEVLKVSADLAVAGFTDLNTAAKAVSSVIQEFGLQTSDATKVANALTVGSNQNRETFERYAKTLPLLLPTLTLFKVGLEQGSAALAVATANGLEAGKAVTGLNQLLLAIGAPTVRAQKYMEELARQLGVAKIEIKRFQDGSADLYATLQQFEGLQPDLMRRLFGGNIESLRTAAILTEHMQDLKRNIDEANTSNEAFARQSALAHSGIAQQWKQSMQAVQVFYDAVGAVIGQSPAVASMVGALSTSFLSLVASIQANKQELATLMEVFAKLGQAGIAVFEGLGHAAIYMAGAVGAAINKIMAGVQSVIGAYNWVKQNIPFVGGGSTGPVFEFPGGEGMAASMKMAQSDTAPQAMKATPGPVIPLQPPRTGLGLSDIQSGIAAEKAAAAESKRAAREAERDAERLAKERIRITEAMADTIAGIEDRQFGKRRLAILQLVADAKAASMDVIQIATFERDALNDLTLDMLDASSIAFSKRVALATDAMKKEDAQIDAQRKALASLRAMSQADDPIERQRLASLDQANEKRLALQNSTIVTSKQLEQDLATATTSINQKALNDRQKQQDEAARKAFKPWQELADDIQRTLSDAFENVLAGTFSVWDGIKKGFIKLLAELAAAAITQAIVIPIFTQAIGAGGGLASLLGGAASTGSFAEGATGADVSAGRATEAGSSAVLGSALSMAGSGASLYTGLSGNSLLGGLAGSNSALGGLLGTELGELGVSGPGYIGGSTGSLGGLSGATIGGLATAAGVGIAAGQIFSKLNAMMGLHGTGNAVLSGAGGGAIAGTMIFPGIGTAIGAAIGALGGYISTLFGKKNQPEPEFNPVTTQAAQVAYDPTQGLHLTDQFAIVREKHKDVGTLDAWRKTFTAINDSLSDMAGQVVSQFQGVAPELQAALVGPLNMAFADIAAKISGLHIAGDSAEEFTTKLQEMMGTTLPGYFNDAVSSVVAQLQNTVKKIEPVFNAFNTVIQTLQKDMDALHGQQLQMHNVLAGAKNALSLELKSPAEAFLVAQGQYGRAKAAFEGGNAAQQITLAPALAQAAQQLLSMSKSNDVLGQDPALVRSLQTSLLQDIDMLTIKTDTAFDSMTKVLQDQVDQAEAQKKILLSGLNNPQNIDTVIANSLDALSSIQNMIAASAGESDPLVTAQVALLGGLNSIGTSQLQVLQDISSKLGGGVGSFAEGSQYVPFSQLAYVHAGERISPATNNYGGDTIHLNVSVNGGDTQSASKIADAVIAEIEKRGGRYGTTSIQVRR